jgi:hypothetical protein
MLLPGGSSAALMTQQAAMQKNLKAADFTADSLNT